MRDLSRPRLYKDAMKNKLTNQYKVITGRISVPATTPAATPDSLVLTSQHPILTDLKILLAPGTILAQDVGMKIFSGGTQILPAMGSGEDSNFTPGWMGLAPGLILDLGELNQQLPGAPYALEFQFYNANAAAAYVFIWARVSPKIELPAMPIEDDKLLKVESSDS